MAVAVVSGRAGNDYDTSSMQGGGKGAGDGRVRDYAELKRIGGGIR